MHLWSSGGKMVVVTEGEIDCVSVSQIRTTSGLSCRCHRCGRRRLHRHSLDWLEGYESVIFMLDMDKPGQEAAVKVPNCCPPARPRSPTSRSRTPTRC